MSYLEEESLSLNSFTKVVYFFYISFLKQLPFDIYFHVDYIFIKEVDIKLLFLPIFMLQCFNTPRLIRFEQIQHKNLFYQICNFILKLIYKKEVVYKNYKQCIEVIERVVEETGCEIAQIIQELFVNQITVENSLSFCFKNSNYVQGMVLSSNSIKDKLTACILTGNNFFQSNLELVGIKGDLRGRCYVKCRGRHFHAVLQLNCLNII